MRTLRIASLLACCALAVNAIAQDEGRRTGTSGQSGTTGSGQTGAGTTTTTETTTQETRQGRRGGIGGQGRGAMAGGMMMQDRDFAAMLSIGNQGEVEMANFVKDKLQNDQAKQFANHMIQDHTQFLQQLSQVAGRPGMHGAGDAAAGNAATGATPPGAGVDVRANAPGGSGVNVAVGGGQGVNVGVGGASRSFYAPGMNPMLQLKQEIAQECLNMAKQELQQKQGVEVDKCYIGTQIVKHQDMLAQLNVIQRRAQDSQFKDMLGQGIQKTQQHLDMAKNIMKQLDQQKSG